MTAITTELNLARNMFGPLSPEIRARLQAVVDQPTQETWDNAYSIIVGADRWMTLWQAVCKLDPSFASVGPISIGNGPPGPWRKIPSQSLIVEALRLATH